MKKKFTNINLPQGFKAAGIACGIKKSGKPDLALIYSEVPAVAAGVFTTSQVKGAPVLVSQAHLKGGIAQAIISNSGNANTWTGKKGLADAREMTRLTAHHLGVPAERVLVTSTGVIAQLLPMEKIRKGIERVVRRLSKKGGHAAARAILTTDTRTKEITVRVGRATIAGIAKGSGMIHPGMATMHAFIATDAEVDHLTLQGMLKKAVDKSFNMISVDNCMSTSDCVFVLANGLAGKIDPHKFYTALEEVCVYLAKEIARDGEGATKLIEVRVEGGGSEREARKVAKALVGNFLLKAAVYGRDRNVGRILQAVGSTNAKVNWKKFKFSWKIGRKEDIIKVNLGVGKSEAIGWGCDLTEGYVRINAKYRT